MVERFSLPALVSQALVVFVIELDNTFELRMPHRTARLGLRGGPPDAPLLASFAMWANCMRYVDEAGTTATELALRARMGTNFDGMRRWGYVTLDGHGRGDRDARVRKDTVIRPTRAGLQAQQIWALLPAEIETLWQSRFGPDTLSALRASLCDLVGQLSADLPDFMPILGYGLVADRIRTGTATDVVSQLPLFALLSRPLIAFGDEFDAASPVSIAMTADVLRPLDATGVPVRELPRLTGVTSEPIAMGLSWLEKRRLVSVVTVDRMKLVRLSAAGVAARGRALDRVREVESSWRDRYGESMIDSVRHILEPLVGDGTPSGSRLFDGLTPPADGWRASIPAPATLPHFPMVTHRGGYPDGA
ncbi:MAG TPA: hypothetical protein VIK08_02330 [Candidatus Limnocylindrales bacterium]